MTRRALFVANGEFADPSIGQLLSPVSDANALATLLARPDIGGYDIRVCADYDAAALRRVIQEFFDSAAPDDLNLMLITGHGLKDRTGSLYFAASDTQLKAVAATSVDTKFIIDRMNDSAAAQQILFVDTCYSGAFLRNTVNKGTAAPITQEDFGPIDQFGKAIITASTSVQPAGEAGDNGVVQSLFTKYLIEGLASGRADGKNTGKVKLGELFEFVRESLRREAPGQTPMPFFSGLDGTLVIARNPLRDGGALPEELGRMVESQDRLQRGQAVEDLVQVAQTNAELRQHAIAALERLSRDDSRLVHQLATKALEDLADSRESAPKAQIPDPERAVRAPAPTLLPDEETETNRRERIIRDAEKLLDRVSPERRREEQRREIRSRALLRWTMLLFLFATMIGGGWELVRLYGTRGRASQAGQIVQSPPPGQDAQSPPTTQQAAAVVPPPRTKPASAGPEQAHSGRPAPSTAGDPSASSRCTAGALLVLIPHLGINPTAAERIRRKLGCTSIKVKIAQGMVYADTPVNRITINDTADRIADFKQILAAVRAAGFQIKGISTFNEKVTPGQFWLDYDPALDAHPWRRPDLKKLDDIRSWDELIDLIGKYP